MCEGATNLALAKLVYHLRYLAKKSYPKSEQLTIALDILNKTKKALCENLQYYQDNRTLRVRNDFNDIVKRILLPGCGPLLFVTTNWDTVVEDYFKLHFLPKHIAESEMARFCLHLHGYYNSPESLYLPTEIIEEDYRDEVLQKNYAKPHMQMLKDLKLAEIIIFYGISISPLDVELLQFLNLVFMDNTMLKEIIVIDKQFNHVAQKLYMNSNLQNISFKGCAPPDLIPIKLF